MRVLLWRDGMEWDGMGWVERVMVGGVCDCGEL